MSQLLLYILYLSTINIFCGNREKQRIKGFKVEGYKKIICSGGKNETCQTTTDMVFGSFCGNLCNGANHSLSVNFLAWKLVGLKSL